MAGRAVSIKRDAARSILRWLAVKPVEQDEPIERDDGSVMVRHTYRTHGEARRAQLFFALFKSPTGKRALAWLMRAGELQPPELR